jgi:hypothetical protein
MAQHKSISGLKVVVNQRHESFSSTLSTFASIYEARDAIESQVAVSYCSTSEYKILIEAHARKQVAHFSERGKVLSLASRVSAAPFCIESRPPLHNGGDLVFFAFVGTFERWHEYFAARLLHTVARSLGMLLLDAGVIISLQCNKFICKRHRNGIRRERAVCGMSSARCCYSAAFFSDARFSLEITTVKHLHCSCGSRVL